jgi:hypothetical protein
MSVLKKPRPTKKAVLSKKISLKPSKTTMYRKMSLKGIAWAQKTRSKEKNYKSHEKKPKAAMSKAESPIQAQKPRGQWQSQEKMAKKKIETWR